MADWSLLDGDILYLIAQRIESPFDTMRFRSVCSSWRSIVAPKRHRSPGRFPFLSNHGISDTTWGFHITKLSIFRINPPPTDRSGGGGWLIKVEEDENGRVKLANPLPSSYFTPLPKHFPKVLDLLNFPIFELCQEYVLKYLNFSPGNNQPFNNVNLYLKKVAYKGLNYDGSEFVLLAIHGSGELALFRSGDGQWSTIQHTALPYEDVMLIGGELYAVDRSGATIMVESQDKVTLMGGPVYGGHVKNLSELNGELLLVDVYLSLDPLNIFGLDGELSEDVVHEKIVGFKVFKLSGDGSKKWIEVIDLGGTMLFVGDGCSFSASALGLSGCKGNCILFNDCFLCPCGGEIDVFEGTGISIFHLEDGSIRPLPSCPEYSRLFWPPPYWITSTSGAIESLPLLSDFLPSSS